MYALKIELSVVTSAISESGSAASRRPGCARSWYFSSLPTQAANAIPPSQQDQMVRAMVDGLAARLRQNPRDADGWIRLMRSRMVLHDAPAAQQALRSGLAAFANDAATQNRLREAAGQLGIPAA